MATALLCGGLEPGHDGVGDYSRELAGELVRMGNRACLISIADRATSEIVEGFQESGGIRICTIRIPDSVRWSEKISASRDFMEKNGVTCISFQFVPYTYSCKGIIRNAVPQLLQVARGRAVHMMFHELWIGNSTSSSLRHRIIGAIQRHYVVALIRKLNPVCLHTSNPAYAAFLARNGFRAEVLPLFGNVPVDADDDRESVRKLFWEHGIDLTAQSRQGLWMAGIFGSIHPEWSPEPFFSELAETASGEGRSVVIVGMGRLGVQGEEIWAEMIGKYARHLRFVLLGPLPVDLISRVFRILDFGISTTPWRVFGKSSTGASMLDHGLPIFVTRDDWKPRPRLDVDYDYPPLIRKYESGGLANLPRFLEMRGNPQSSRSAVAHTLLESFRRAGIPSATDSRSQ